jgi:P-type Ca2+ transporter type 2C
LKENSFYELSIESAYEELGSSKAGLKSNEAEARLQHFGLNKITVKSEPWWKKLLEPFKNVFMLILGIAALISVVTGETIDAAIILSIIGITAIIYYGQRFSADRVLRALERHDLQTVKVFRDGRLVDRSSEELVPGDIINLNEGEKVPADARVVHSDNLRSDEAMLTGESVPVSKNNHQLSTDKKIYERTNMLFSGSYIVSGNVLALVTSTGNDTEFGQLAVLTNTRTLSSPVQEKIDKLISQIVGFASILALFVFALSVYRGFDLAEALHLVLTFSVSAIPEGLPIAISVVMILGMRRMAKYKALVRNMRAIENIGIVTTIATDKTGTLTKNQLTVQDVWTDLEKNYDLQVMARAIFYGTNQSEGNIHDPLDNAFIDFATKYGQDYHENDGELIKAVPFEHRFSMSGNTWKLGHQYETFIKGAPEKVISRCDLSAELKAQAEKKLHSLTGSGYRVIAMCKTRPSDAALVDFEQLDAVSLEFIGLIAVADELREESAQSVEDAQNAGITVRMITGDHFETAFAIAKKIGLAEHKSQVFDCSNMDKMTDREVEDIVADVRVFARVLPEYKHRILGILKQSDITAMTGDGVNDVPALANAHIGIAMGSGSQIAKEAGDIVLLDDNFKTITSAIREGRIIFDNVRRMLFYLLSTNLGEVLTTVVALVIGLPIPLLPVQILWTNLGTDTVMVIPLGLEPAERDAMKRPPRRPNKPILGRVIITRLIIVSSTIMLVALGVFSYFLGFESETYARTMVFSALVAMQLTNALNARSEKQSIFSRIFVKNHAVIVGLLAAIGLYWLAVFGPLQNALRMTDVRIEDLFVVWIISFITITIVNETFKLVDRKKHNLN